MERQVFKVGYVSTIISFIIMTIVFGAFYYALKNPYIMLIYLFIILYSIWAASKNKLVVENGNLRLEKVINSKEVRLDDVSHIVSEQRESTNSDGDSTTSTYMRVLDQAGHSVFTFSFSYVANREDQQRFIDAVHAFNPSIEMNFNTSFDNLKIIMKDFKEYRKNKKEEKKDGNVNE